MTEEKPISMAGLGEFERRRGRGEADLRIGEAEFLGIQRHPEPCSGGWSGSHTSRAPEETWRMTRDFVSRRASLDDGLHLFHVVEIVGRNGVTVLDSVREHFGVHEAESLIRTAIIYL